MGLAELFLVAVGLSMDAFAASVLTGLSSKRATLKKAVTVGLYFGVFQALMPLIGYLLATRFADRIVAYDHWVAFALLGAIGGKMIADGLQKDQKAESADTDSPSKMLAVAVATSVDALAIGVSFAFLRVSVIPSVITIGVTTFVLSVAGVKLGGVFGARFKSRAELTGGIVLILIGFKILLEHLGILQL